MNRCGGLGQLMTDLCSITVREAEENADHHLMEYREVTVAENIPCRVSFSGAPAAEEGAAAAVAQSVKLFLPPDIDLPPGSRIAVTRGEKTLYYTRSGEPALYPDHQEINLELWRRWA